jgi:two-component system, OmpR family, sensor histidine kinase TctE
LRKPSNSSIRNQLLAWLLLPLCILWVVGAVCTYFLAESSANSVYDEGLMSSADSIVARVRHKGNLLDVDLPPSALAILERGSKEKFYFQVYSADGKFLDGDSVLPPPGPLLNQPMPFFEDCTIEGESVRAVMIEASVEESPAIHVFIRVAETLHDRTALARQILFHTVFSQLIVIVFGALAVYCGVTAGLRPLEQLRKDVSRRSQSDLRPLNTDHAPQEVRPLVQSINELLAILREDIESKQRFVANAAHQLRTPLAGLKTYIGILKKLVTSPNAVEVLNQLDCGADRTTHMVNRLLALAKAEPNSLRQMKQEVIDLNSVVSESASTLVPEAVNKKIDLSFESSGGAAIILGDRPSLQELAVNIIENAVRYTPENGTVTVAVTSGDTVRFVVEDTGPGIPAHERERVFERFYRILGTGVSGSGLGLSIVSEIARAHNARVLISTPAGGTGTRVEVEFIRAKSANEWTAIETEAKQAKQAKGSQKQ